MNIKEKLCLNEEDCDKWSAFEQPMREIANASNESSELFKEVSNLLYSMNDIECKFVEDD